MFDPRLILDGAPLIAIHKGRYYRRKEGLALGPGPFVTGLEYAADCRATVVGKPEKTFFTQALSDLGCSPSEAVMIGDVRTREPGASSFTHNHLWVTLLPSALLLQDVRDDVGGAQDAGMLGILVRTGKNKPLVRSRRRPVQLMSFPVRLKGTKVVGHLLPV